MARKSMLRKSLILLLPILLFTSTLLLSVEQVFADSLVQAQAQEHTLYSASYEKVYANPDAKKEEAAFLFAVLSLHPALQQFRILRDALAALGLWQSFQALLDREEAAKKAQGYYIVEKQVYKSVKPTQNYWGYSQTYIFSSALRQKVKGKTVVIGRTTQ